LNGLVHRCYKDAAPNGALYGQREALTLGAPQARNMSNRRWNASRASVEPAEQPAKNLPPCKGGTKPGKRQSGG